MKSQLKNLLKACAAHNVEMLSDVMFILYVATKFMSTPKNIIFCDNAYYYLDFFEHHAFMRVFA